ncbi:MAG: flagellar biosynthesis anti-sigma factor FlgM [Pseudomonadota bacterium]
MKIDPGIKQVNLPTAVENRPAQVKAGARPGAEQTDVTLSARAGQLKELETRLESIPVVDRAKVDAIKEAIASGQYTVNAENVAQGLVDSVKEMLHVAKAK